MLDKSEVTDVAKYEISLSWVNTADGTEEYLDNIDITKEDKQLISGTIETKYQKKFYIHYTDLI
jgi:hypothetical protein